MKLSVLIPFRNAAPFIGDCVHALVRQNLDDVECIFLDDASNDMSGQLLAAALARECLDVRSRILVHSIRQGVSRARQDLLSAATGDFVLFLDADDLVEPGMFTAMLEKIESTGADLVWADYLEENRFGPRLVQQNCPEDPRTLLASILRGKTGGFLWNKLFRRNFVLSHGIRFLPGIECQEDLAFICEVLSHAPRIVHLGAAHYHYRQWRRSAVRQRMGDQLPSFSTLARHFDDLFAATTVKDDFAVWKRRLRFDASLAADVSAEQLAAFLPEADGIVGCGFGSGKRLCHGLVQHHLRFFPCLLKSVYLRFKALTLLAPPRPPARVQLTDCLGEDFNAMTKAPADIDRIADGMGFQRIALARVDDHSLISLIRRRIVRIAQVVLLPFRVPHGAVLLFQFPRTDASSRLGFVLLRLLRIFRRIRLITLIHDLNGMREATIGENAQWRERERLVMKWSDRMIVHNDLMADWLVAHGVARERIIVLGIFDYLCDTGEQTSAAVFSRQVVIAGNLDTTTEKSQYLTRLSEIPVNWKLYGPGFDSSAINGGGIRYEGCIPPKDLPARLTSGFGLVWDGKSVETCNGAYGDYLRLNNPHKLSLYLASGLPVIIWSEAAEAEFVLENDVGLTVRSLHDLPAALSSVTPERYAELAANAKGLSNMLRTGHFMRTALVRALAIRQS